MAGLENASWHAPPNATQEFLQNASYASLQNVVTRYLTPGLCLFGVFGNVVNLMVLSRLHRFGNSREKGANVGLMALAFSDMLFCIAVFPTVFTDHSQLLFSQKSFLMYYQLYGTGFVTMFLLTSTWITVTLATLRYFAICRSLSGWSVDSTTSVGIIYVSVSCVAVVINIPTFFQFKITQIPYTEGRHLYMIDIGVLDDESAASQAFLWIRCLMFIIIPVAILLFCNFSLVHTLHNSRRLREQYHVSSSAYRSQNRITLLLVIIALAFIVLVLPSELMDVFMGLITRDKSRTEAFLMSRVVANALQMLSFSCNFVLYCTLNAHFRSTLKDVVLCRKRSQRSSRLTVTFRPCGGVKETSLVNGSPGNPLHVLNAKHGNAAIDSGVDV